MSKHAVYAIFGLRSIKSKSSPFLRSENMSANLMIASAHSGNERCKK